MPNSNLPKIKLSASQVRSAVTGTLAVLVTLNQFLQQIAGTPSLHLPHWLTATIQLVGVVVPMMSRSLDKSRSGTGGGLVGSAPDTAAQATQGGLLPLTQELPVAAQEIASVAVPTFFATLESELSAPGKLTAKSLVAQVAADELKAAAQELTKEMNREALLAGIAAKGVEMAETKPVSAAAVYTRTETAPETAPETVTQTPAEATPELEATPETVPAIEPASAVPAVEGPALAPTNV